MTTDQLRFILNTLRDKHEYDDDFRNKEKHKLSYLVYAKSRDRGADVSIPYFWYRYGVVTQQPNTDSSSPLPSLSKSDKQIINRVCDRVLEDYYASSLDDVTDETYRDAPYPVFPAWRELDKKLSTIKDNYNPFFDNTPIRDEIETKVERVYDSFPADEFPKHESDLATWYFAMVRELDQGMNDVERLQRINTTFWGIFTLSVAEKQHPNMTTEEVLTVLDIESFAAELNRRRKKLHKLERDALGDRSGGREVELGAATDAVIEPLLESLNP